jgi:hypothetical protein
MRREVSVFLPVPGYGPDLTSAFALDPGAWMPAGSRQEGPHRWLVPQREAGLDVVRWEIGVPVRTTRAVWRTVTWEPRPGHRRPANGRTKGARSTGRRPDMACPGIRDAETIAVGWELPILSAHVGIAREGDDGTVLTCASYELPPGALDHTDPEELHRVARRTAEGALCAIARGIGARESGCYAERPVPAASGPARRT